MSEFNSEVPHLPLNLKRSCSRRGLCLGLRHELVDVRRRLAPLPERGGGRLLEHDGAAAQLHRQGAARRRRRAEEGLGRQLLLQLEVIRRRQE